MALKKIKNVNWDLIQMHPYKNGTSNILYAYCHLNHYDIPTTNVILFIKKGVTIYVYKLSQDIHNLEILDEIISPNTYTLISSNEQKQ